MKDVKTAADVLAALSTITAGRTIQPGSDQAFEDYPFVITKTSGLKGKAVTETPGLVCGSPDHAIGKLAVSMTLTESQIELAGAIGVDAIVTHHPVADAASSGGVPLKGYVDLYGLAVFEVHEAFHGRHPGIAWIHGHQPFRVEIAYGGLKGNIMFVGRILPEVKTAGDLMARLSNFSNIKSDRSLLEAERQMACCSDLLETNVSAEAFLLTGSPENRVSTVVHFFPHTGFNPDHLKQVKSEHPEIDTAIVSISRVRPDHPLVSTARELGLTMLAGNSHALEILENGLPLAHALSSLLPGVEVVVFKERVVAYPLEILGGRAIQEYARRMAEEHLI